MSGEGSIEEAVKQFAEVSCPTDEFTGIINVDQLDEIERVVHFTLEAETGETKTCFVHVEEDDGEYEVTRFEIQRVEDEEKETESTESESVASTKAEKVRQYAETSFPDDEFTGIINIDELRDEEWVIHFTLESESGETKTCYVHVEDSDPGYEVTEFEIQRVE